MAKKLIKKRMVRYSFVQEDFALTFEVDYIRVASGESAETVRIAIRKKNDELN